MKGNHLFIICIAIFLLLMFAIECRLPKSLYGLLVSATTINNLSDVPFSTVCYLRRYQRGILYLEKPFMNWNRKTQSLVEAY